MMMPMRDGKHETQDGQSTSLPVSALNTQRRRSEYMGLGGKRGRVKKVVMRGTSGGPVAENPLCTVDVGQSLGGEPRSHVALIEPSPVKRS